MRIEDFFHAAEYLWAAARARHGPGGDLAKAWARKLCRLLKAGRVDDVLAQLRRPGGGSAECAKTADHIDERRGQMRYDEYLARGLSIGSGRAEAACKTVLGRRQSRALGPLRTPEWLVRRLLGRPPAVDRMRRSVFTHQTFVAHPIKGRLPRRHQPQLMDRMFQTAARLASPPVLFTEGGGGRASGGSRNARPGRGGSPQVSGGGGLNTSSWTLLSKLSGRVPVVGVNAGFCFAGNAVLLGCCDVIIATANSSIGIGGPAMIEGGGLGVYSPEEVGPMSVQIPSGVVDIAVADEAEAVRATKKYLSYFQGPLDDWEADDQRRLRHVVPENRLRVYDIRELIDILADKDSVLELRPEFGTAMITSFIRIEGRPLGVIANNPAVISGAIDSDAADKAARFMKTCDAFQIPLLLLCDCPGIMVGPEVEKTGLVRHGCTTNPW